MGLKSSVSACLICLLAFGKGSLFQAPGRVGDSAHFQKGARAEIAKVYRLIRDGAKPPLSTASPPPPQFYGTCYGRKCRRYFCTVCGSLATTNLHSGQGQNYGREQRAVDWLSGTTLPDAITRAQQFHTELHR
ncbi:hypothetical protein T265_02909 [Opisthorchis viverrini]|uniref:Uncharacterized protein n=1 Tax=Opisthorchis viverrini TaxID=6198 RepID=A0A074ZXT1_OPIVI|nr:hypothetical protein T265_02909 [Opisthorchis viverrini]KER30767.1 hypothetical protein T265_02909 [Opisthorchis viverrini]